MHRVATMSAGQTADSAAAGSLSALSGGARVTFASMTSISSSSDSGSPHTPWAASSDGASAAAGDATAAGGAGGAAGGGGGGSGGGNLSRAASLDRMASLESLGGGSLDSTGAPSLGLPPSMPSLLRNHSLTVPLHARVPPPMQRVASDASIGPEQSVEGLVRVPTMMRIPSEAGVAGGVDPDYPLSISRAVSMEVANGQVTVESPRPGSGQRNLPGSLAFGQQMMQQQQQLQRQHLQQQHQQQMQQLQMQHAVGAQMAAAAAAAASAAGARQMRTHPSPEDMLVSLLTPRSFSNITSRVSSDVARAPVPVRKPTATTTTGGGTSGGKAKTTFVCDYVNPKTKKVCGHKFARQAGLQSHRRTHSAKRQQRSDARRTTGERKYKCDWVDPDTGEKCTNAYTHSRSLIEHKCKHTGEWLHECADCGKRFTVNSNFKRHRDKVDCKAKLLRKQQKEAAEAEKAARAAATRMAKGGGGGGASGGDAKRARRSQAI